MYIFHLYYIPVADSDQYRGELQSWYIFLSTCDI